MSPVKQKKAKVNKDGVLTRDRTGINILETFAVVNKETRGRIR
jgi:hypothetical protein